jgi:uncharacterized protein DUF4019
MIKTTYLLQTPARLTATSFVVIVLLQIFASAQTVSEDRVAFTVIEAPWMVSLNSQNLEIKDQQVKHDNRSGYFLMSNETDNLTVSLFIEPAVKCRTGSECRDYVLKTGNPEWGEFQDLVKSQIGDFSYFEFFRPVVQNQPLQILDLYAEYVADGYWVDLHISKVLYKKADHLLFENLINSIRFVSKTSAPTADSDKFIKEAQTAAETWVLLWDSGKYSESYKELSEPAKNAFDEKSWAAYWTTERKRLGKLKWRKIINTSLVKSLEKLPDHSGAVLKYQSSFENQKDVFETFYLVLEKHGAWRVLGYETNE